jgi:Tol biopolymer transport system component
MTPPALDRVVRKCIAKNPDDRWQTARDLVGELRWISEGGSQAAAPVIPAHRRVRFQAGWIAAAVLATALAGLLAIHLREPHPAERTVRFHLPLPEGTSFRSVDTAVLSPDGTRVVFSAQDSNATLGLYVRSLDSLDTNLIPGTRGDPYGSFPFWSPDGRFIAFFADQALKKVDLLGGNPITLCPAYGPHGGTWNHDGVILFSSLFNPIKRVSANGGKPTPATRGTSQGQHWPSFLPDGKHFLFTATPGGGIYAGSLDSLDVKQVSIENSRGEYSSAGFLIFGRSGTVMAQPFDAARLRVTGVPIQIADTVKPLFSLQGATPAFSAVGDALVYLSGSAAGGLSQLTWFDRKGGRGGVIGDAADYSNPALSPDGRLLAVGKRDPVSGTRDIYIFDLVHEAPQRRLTFDPGDDFNPLWSPDGQKIVFVSNRKGHRDLYWKASSGVGSEEVLLESGDEKSCEDWTRDGRYVIYTQTTDKPREIRALPLFGDHKPFSVISGLGVAEGHVSPNGKWISYTSSESGTPEIYVQDFPPTGSKWQVSTGGGFESSWNANGKELFYLQGNRLMAVDVNAESGSFDRGTPRMLFDAPIANKLRNAYLATTDGQKFLINARIETKDTLPMTLVLNWPAALKH